MQLNFKKFGEGFPVIILHGLLGSLDNWQTIAKKLVEASLATYHSLLAIYIVDQRNHGRSPHSSEFNYELLSNDLLEFFEQQNISKAHLIGHSMGGKASMKFALKHAEKVEKLILVDVAPTEHEDGHSDVFKALFAADVKNATSREQVEKVLREKLNNDEATVQFLLKGLQRAEQGFQWKFNLESLNRNYHKISEAVISAKPYEGETLFIKGEKSNYINPSNHNSLVGLFPHYQLVEIKGAGHWVHADRPPEFVLEVMRFLT